jgi:hypothetical protein
MGMIGGFIGAIRAMVRASTSPYDPILTLVLTACWLAFGWGQNPFAAIIGALALYRLASQRR